MPLSTPLSPTLTYVHGIVVVSCLSTGRGFGYIDDVMLTPEGFEDLGTHWRDMRVYLKEQVWEISLQRTQRLGIAVAFTGASQLGKA